MRGSVNAASKVRTETWFRLFWVPVNLPHQTVSGQGQKSSSHWEDKVLKTAVWRPLAQWIWDMASVITGSCLATVTGQQRKRSPWARRSLTKIGDRERRRQPSLRVRTAYHQHRKTHIQASGLLPKDSLLKPLVQNFAYKAEKVA